MANRKLVMTTTVPNSASVAVKEDIKVKLRKMSLLLASSFPLALNFLLSGGPCMQENVSIAFNKQVKSSVTPLLCYFLICTFSDRKLKLKQNTVLLNHTGSIFLQTIFEGYVKREAQFCSRNFTKAVPQFYRYSWVGDCSDWTSELWPVPPQPLNFPCLLTSDTYQEVFHQPILSSFNHSLAKSALNAKLQPLNIWLLIQVLNRL